MKKKTVQTKSQLAKLLATENIEVQENKASTASFDVKNRILTIPIFKKEHKSGNHETYVHVVQKMPPIQKHIPKSHSIHSINTQITTN